MQYHVLEKARRALDEYIDLMTGREHAITVKVDAAAFHVSDPKQDDAYRVLVTSGAGKITASNERAALIAVYHLLRENGCGFARPGKEGERVPRCALSDICADLSITAAHRFRGLCIEGACNIEDTLALLEWMPKVGMNCYFMQFREGYNFFERWYECEANGAVLPWEFNLDVCRSIVRRVSLAARQNGLMYHAVGHGFTCECFGVDALGWIKADHWPKEWAHALAMRNGKRDMAQDIPLISARCYSTREVQKFVVEKAAEYIAGRPEIDYVHFWLDDGNNNKCECEVCRDTRVAEFYIQMLNLLDERLTEMNVPTKIVFLGYHELLWPPEKEILRNPARFTFMFAPIQRSFIEPLSDAESAGEMKPYTLNHQPFPKNNGEMAAHLKAWNAYRRKVGMPLEDSFDFDYYNVNFNDPGQFVQARLLYEDIKNLKRNGLGGIINCQAQRAFDHAALPMYVLARALVQPELTLDALADEYFNAAFGEGWRWYKDYFARLTALSEPLRTRGGAQNFAALLEALGEQLPEIAPRDLAVSRARKLLRFTQKTFTLLTKMVESNRRGNEGLANHYRAEADAYTAAHECEFSIEFDRKYFTIGEYRLLHEV